MTRFEIINILISKYGFNSYLEIGVGTGESFKLINCENKECCDPYDKNLISDGWYDNVTYNMTSDEMFKQMDKNKKFDIIFIDGLHYGNQVLKDVWNSLEHINKNGFILIHDSLPMNEDVCHYPRRNGDGCWLGTVYKIYPVLLEQKINFSIIDDDFGIGIIRGDQKFRCTSVPKESGMSYKDIFLNKNKNFNYRKLFKVYNTLDEYLEGE